MILSRAPYRISFFGGGSDYPAYFQERGGSILSATLAHYCHITCRWLPPFFSHKSRVVWSKIELVGDPGEIDHPSVRECLRFLGIDRGVEIHHDGDLPGRSGLGSSSSFTVALLHALHALRGEHVGPRRLADEAIHVEQDLMGECVGVQDQIAAAFGGLNAVEIERDGSYSVAPLPLPPRRMRELEARLMLFFTGLSRTASEIAAEQVKATPGRLSEISRMREMARIGAEVLSAGDFRRFGELLHESWLVKRSLTDRVSTEMADRCYEDARRAGAIGGKLVGAGGGGFLLLCAEPEDQPEVRRALEGLVEVPVKFGSRGSEIVYHQPQEEPEGEMRTRLAFTDVSCGFSGS